MAKKTKDAAATAKKEVKPNKPADPNATKNLIRLLNILALLLAVIAFLLQLFAVLSHHWKWQTTNLHKIISPTYHYGAPNVYENSLLDQHYGLYSRNVRIYANNDEQLELWGSTRFPRIDDGEENFHHCLSQTSSLRGALLTCSNRVVSPGLCHCRRYIYWNFVIAFEIIALILLGIVVFLTALLTTQFHGILKPAAAGLALLAFILLLIGLILILTHLKRETRSFADAYPHIHQRLADKIGIVHDQYRAEHRNPTAEHQNPTAEDQNPTVLDRAVRRRAVHRRDDLDKPVDHYRAYPLLPGQHPYNDTHFQEYSEEARTWVYLPYTSINPPAAYAALSSLGKSDSGVAAALSTTTAPVYNQYGPVLGYDGVFEYTRAGIGWSTILSIIALVLALLLALILIFSWLTGKKLAPSGTTIIKTTTTEYELLPQQDVPVHSTITVPAQTVTVKPIPVNYSPDRPIGDAIVTTRNVPQGPYDSHGGVPETVIVRDVIIRDESPGTQTTQQLSYPVVVDTTQTTYRT
jgi:hypothetical protein